MEQLTEFLSSKYTPYTLDKWNWMTGLVFCKAEQKIIRLIIIIVIMNVICAYISVMIE